MKIDPVRRRALDVLTAVGRGRDLGPLLDEALAGLEAERSRAFLVELVRGTLQWQGRYDHLVHLFARRNPPRDPRLLALLRLTLHQLVSLDGVPPFAAIHQAGELCRARISYGLVGFVNGLMRTVARELDLAEEGATAGEDSGREERLRPLFRNLESQPAAWLAGWHSHPHWLVERWIARFGAETAAAICAHNNEPVGIDFHVLAPADPGRTAQELDAAGIPVAPGTDPRTLHCTGRPGRGALTQVLADLPQLIVQDATVQAATSWLIGDDFGNGPEAAYPLLDLCAAPGGKTARLAAVTENRVAAMDNRSARTKLLAQTVARTRSGPVDVVQGDGRCPPFGPGAFGAVLLDGPCSGTGVLRRHPDGRWRNGPETPKRNGETLKELARQAVDLLAPGGLLMYATCSLEREENEDVVAALLAACPDLSPASGGDAAGRTWLPHISGGDGFFAARLRRRSGPDQGSES